MWHSRLSSVKSDLVSLVTGLDLWLTTCSSTQHCFRHSCLEFSVRISHLPKMPTCCSGSQKWVKISQIIIENIPALACTWNYHTVCYSGFPWVLIASNNEFENLGYFFQKKLSYWIIIIYNFSPLLSLLFILWNNFH